MNCLQYKIAKVESFLSKLKALIDIAENHLHDQILLRNLEQHMDNFIHGIASMDEIHFAPLVASALARLSVSRPSVEVVEKLIDMFPSSLECQTENGLFPLQHAAMNITFYAKYIHLFVRASCSGNLHLRDRPVQPYQELAGQNILQYLVCSTGYECAQYKPVAIRFDESLANAIDHFCKQGFITKEDIENYDLLALCCNKSCMRRFEVLARWHKKALKTSRVEDKPLLYHHLSEGNFDSIEVFLRASFQLFPDESGLLFFGDYSNQCHVRMYRYVVGYSFSKTLEKVIRPISFPLLHQMCKRSDGGLLLCKFETCLPYLRKLFDEDGRSYHQALFAYCNYTLGSHTRVNVGNIAIEELETRDPVTGLLPFVTVAANDSSIGFIYDLLLKHPTALLNCMESSGGQKGGPMTLKRKHCNSNYSGIVSWFKIGQKGGNIIEKKARRHH